MGNTVYRNYFNEDVKYDFMNHLERKNKSYINSFSSLFELVAKFEELYKKDLYYFTNKDLMMFFTNISENIKLTTAETYNFLIVNYKEWAKKIIDETIDTTVLSKYDLRTISTFKKYIVLNDDDILDITQRNIVIDGADYNPVIFIRLFWEIDGAESMKDILDIKVDRLDRVKHTIFIKNTDYTISPYLTSLIYNFAETDTLTFKNKRGEYRILTAKENDGYIFRASLYSGEAFKTNVGQPISVNKFSSFILPKFCKRHIDIIPDAITTNDLLMSLAIRYMLKNKKTHVDMQREKKYFSNVPSYFYYDSMVDNAPTKFKNEYYEYMEYFKFLKRMSE